MRTGSGRSAGSVEGDGPAVSVAPPVSPSPLPPHADTQRRHTPTQVAVTIARLISARHIDTPARGLNGFRPRSLPLKADLLVCEKRPVLGSGPRRMLADATEVQRQGDRRPDPDPDPTDNAVTPRLAGLQTTETDVDRPLARSSCSITLTVSATNASRDRSVGRRVLFPCPR